MQQYVACTCFILLHTHSNKISFLTHLAFAFLLCTKYHLLFWLWSHESGTVEGIYCVCSRDSYKIINALIISFSWIECCVKKEKTLFSPIHNGFFPHHCSNCTVLWGNLYQCYNYENWWYIVFSIQNPKINYQGLTGQKKNVHIIYIPYPV